MDVRKYFSLDEDFDVIIRNVLKNEKINLIKQISTGWTNIVFEVSTNSGNYFFRFPRDNFWSRTIVKDYEFSNYIFGKTDFETVKLNLLYDNDRAFSIHRKIEGVTLADKMDSLNAKEIKQISQDIAKFMFQLHNVKFKKEEIFKTNNIGLNLADFLDELLEVHVSKNDKVFWNYEYVNNKPKNCLVHGDFNSSNIILDNNNQLKAIIDFGFAGFGNMYDDIARIMSRGCPESFKDEIINTYETLLNSSLNQDILNNEITTWKNIDSAYINYMRGIGIYGG